MWKRRSKLISWALPAIYWLAVTLAPSLHDHAHHDHSHSHVAVKSGHTCSHHHHAGHHHRHAHGHAHSHKHSHSAPQHQHGPGAPLHDDDCSACRFLALKPAPTAPATVAVTVEQLPQEAPEFTPTVERTALPLPESRGPPTAV